MNISKFAAALGRAQVAYPKRFLITSTAVTIIAGLVASGLVFNASFEALLPEDSEELANVADVRSQTGGTRQIVAVIQGADPEKRLAFAEKLADRIGKIDGIRFVDVRFPVDFFEERGLWLMPAERLDALIPALEEAVRVSKWQANPMNLGLDPESEKAEMEAAWQKVDAVVRAEEGNLPFSRVLTSKDGASTFALIVPNITFGDVAIGKRLINRIKEEIAALDPAASGVTVATAGNLDIVQEQNETMVADLRATSTLAFGLGIVLVALTLRRLTAPFVIGVSLIFGVTWTFALARIFIGQVNVITSFLVAVLFGLGIDFGIHLFVRFEQALRLHKRSVKAAVAEAVAGTLPPAVTGAMTTAGTFFSFALADFRGFSEFGLIAGMGVLLTLLSSFLVLPPLLVVHARERRSDQNVKAPSYPKSGVVRSPVALIVTAAFLALAGFGALSIDDIRFENNFRELRGHSPATDLADWVNQNLGAGFNPAVLLAESVSDAAAIKETALRQKETVIDGRPSRIDNVFTVSDLLPADPEATAPKIEALRSILLDPKLDRAIDKGGERAEQLKLARKMVQTAPWQLADLPDVFNRRLTTVDGDKYLVFVWPDKRNDSDVEALAWEDELKRLSSALRAKGIPHEMADETLAMAWIYRTILGDGLPLLTVAAVVVLVLLFLDFRSIRRTLLVAFPLACGMFCFAALIRLLGMSLNMYNMIVLPSVIGIGVDNAVHIFHRYRVEGPGSLKLVVRTTGMAALLASVTTGIGFGASLISHNVGLQSLGLLAVVGIATTFFSTVVFFPSLLSLLERYGVSKGPR